MLFLIKLRVESIRRENTIGKGSVKGWSGRVEAAHVRASRVGGAKVLGQERPGFVWEAEQAVWPAGTEVPGRYR